MLLPNHIPTCSRDTQPDIPEQAAVDIQARNTSGTLNGQDARARAAASQNLPSQEMTEPVPLSRQELPAGSQLLYGQYEIEAALSAGGFGMTYLARDSLERRVVIKECFPAGLCQRDPLHNCVPLAGYEGTFRGLLRSFLREARLLARPDHANIVAVHQVFRENGTGYIAMEHVDGADLETLRSSLPKESADGPNDTSNTGAFRGLSGDMLMSIAHQVLMALETLHGMGILHRDVSPDNLLMDEKAHITLIDFGAAAHIGRLEEMVAYAPIAVKDGYSPPELYNNGAAQGPQSDLYALGATLYFLVTGDVPCAADLRQAASESGRADPLIPLESGPWPYDLSFLAMIDRALRLDPADRFQSAGDWRASLSPNLCPDPRPELRTGPLPSVPPEPPNAPATATDPEPLGADLQDRISQLVAQTNHRLEPHLPRALRPAPRVVEPETPTERQLVDLFGEPIHDIDAWFREQERAGPLAFLASHPSDQAPPTVPEPPSFQTRVARLLNKRQR